MGMLRQDKSSRRSPNAGKVLALARTDAPEVAKGKPCGESNIPKSFKCNKGSGLLTTKNLKTTAKLALAVGVLTGGAYLAKRKFMSMEEWRNSSQSFRNNPKLTPEQAQKIADEAIAGGQKWNVQEDINARRLQAECGGGLGKLIAPAKFDAEIRTPRCQAGAGSFGTYFVHPSEEYGVKLYRNGDDDVQWEADRLDRAHAAGVNVPQPLGMNAIQTPDGDTTAQTLILSHKRGYKTIADQYNDASYTAINAPRIIQLKIAREFRKLHTAGLAHGDVHAGNIMVDVRSKKVSLIDFGYSTDISDAYNPHSQINGVDTLLSDLKRLPQFVGFNRTASQDFLQRHSGVLTNIETQANDYSRSWDKYELAIKRYHDALEAELLRSDRRPRSRFISGADQPRIPGLTRGILTANVNTVQRKIVEKLPVAQADPSFIKEMAKGLGIKPANLRLALQPERDARRARNRAQPFGTPL